MVCFAAMRAHRSDDVRSGDLPAFLRVEEVARILRISRSAAYELANAWLATDGEAGLPAVRLGRSPADPARRGRTSAEYRQRRRRRRLRYRADARRPEEDVVHLVRQDQPDESTHLHQGARDGSPVVLSIGKLSLGQEAYYLEEVLDGAEDYYLHVGEAPGRWLGTGAAEVGVRGEVTAGALRSVLAGNDPATGEPLRVDASRPAGARPHVVGAQVGVAGLGARRRARPLGHRCCLSRAGGRRRHHLPRTSRLRRASGPRRSGDGGRRRLYRRRLPAPHQPARRPALHTHVLVANLTRGEDGRWTALDARHLYRHARPAGFVYQAVLRYELARSLGLLFEEVEQGHADVAGVPDRDAPGVQRATPSDPRSARATRRLVSQGGAGRHPRHPQGEVGARARSRAPTAMEGAGRALRGRHRRPVDRHPHAGRST